MPRVKVTEVEDFDSVGFEKIKHEDHFTDVKRRDRKREKKEKKWVSRGK